MLTQDWNIASHVNDFSISQKSDFEVREYAPVKKKPGYFSRGQEF